ncbi:MAG: hypothetical protein J0L96_21805 [Anaerolineae bacterium]|nr:hypothetical protein [Anaerolineae bacterium]
MQILLITLFVLMFVSCSSVQTNQTSTIGTSQPPNIITVTQLPTSTLVSTLPVKIRQQNLIELFSNNGGCAFPCWWGVGLGDPIREISDLASLIGETPFVSGSYYSFTFPLGELNSSDFAMSFNIDEFKKVKGIEIFLNQPSRFSDYYDVFEKQLSLTGILAHYGMPSETLFLVTPRFEPGGGLRSYTLLMIYDNQDFGIKYSGIVSAENPLKICPIKVNDYYLQNIELYLDDPRSKVSEINRFNSAELKPIDSVNPMKLNEIYRVLSSSNNNECLLITVDPWQ